MGDVHAFPTGKGYILTRKLLLKLLPVLAGTGGANMAQTLKYQLFLRWFLHAGMRHFVLVNLPKAVYLLTLAQYERSFNFHKWQFRIHKS